MITYQILLGVFIARDLSSLNFVIADLTIYVYRAGTDSMSHKYYPPPPTISTISYWWFFFHGDFFPT